MGVIGIEEIFLKVKDMEKAQAHPDACKDEKGRLRVAAATGISDDGVARAEALGTRDIVLVVTPEGNP